MTAKLYASVYFFAQPTFPLSFGNENIHNLSSFICLPCGQLSGWDITAESETLGYKPYLFHRRLVQKTDNSVRRYSNIHTFLNQRKSVKSFLRNNRPNSVSIAVLCSKLCWSVYVTARNRFIVVIA